MDQSNLWIFMRHPLLLIPEGKLRWSMIPAGLVTASTVLSLPFVMPMRDTATVVDLVEAGSAVDVQYLVSSWTDEEKVKAAYAVGMDYLMTPAYMSVIALSLVWCSRRAKQPPYERQLSFFCGQLRYSLSPTF